MGKRLLLESPFVVRKVVLSPASEKVLSTAETKMSSDWKDDPNEEWMSILKDCLLAVRSSVPCSATRVKHF